MTSRALGNLRRCSWAPWPGGPVALLLVLIQTGVVWAPNDPAVGTPPPVEIDRDVENFSRVLGSSPDAETRQWAAESLLRIDHDKARQVLADALTSDDPALVEAIARALTSTEITPAPELLPPLVQALGGSATRVRDPLGRALVRYGAVALNELAALAVNREAKPELRQGVIHALGGFRSRAGVSALMAVLEQQPPEEETILHAACDSLARLTRLTTYGHDPAQWRTWWADAQNQPEEEWLSALVAQLSEQIRDLETEKGRQQIETDRIATRLFKTMQDLFPLLSKEEQTRRLPGLLADEFTTVRHFALTRIDVLLRDGVIPPASVQDKLAERLTDATAANRMEAGRLLDELAFPGLPDRLAQVIVTEQDKSVLGSFLELLRKRPSPAATPKLIELVADPTLGDQAADVLWSMASANPPSLTAEDQTAAADAAAAAAFASRASSKLARVIVRCGNDEQARSLDEHLDGDDPAMRGAIAEAMFARGRTQPLIDRVADVAIFPYAVRALAAGGATLENFAALVSQIPPREHTQLWADQLVRLSQRFTPEELLAVDNLMASHPHVEVGLRIRVLERVRQLGAADLPSDQRIPLAMRLARHLLASDRAGDAHGLLTALNGEADTEPLRAIRFEAAARSGAFDVAANIHSLPGPWVDLLTALAQNKPQQQQALYDEIGRRFVDQLQGELRQRFDAAGRLIATANGGGGPEAAGGLSGVDTDI